MTHSDLPRELADMREDPLGHGIGYKDANVHSDLLQALTLLAEVSPDARVSHRLAEVYEIVATRFVTIEGAVHYLTQADLTPVPGIERFGYPLQTGFRLAPAARVVGGPASNAGQLARRMLDHAIDWAWDNRRSGFVEAGPAAEPPALAGTPIGTRNRPWLVQAEGAKLLLQVALDEPAPGRYHALFDRLMNLIETEFVDRRHGGWQVSPRSDWPLRRRLLGPAGPKSDMWKDASHEADMYLAALRMLGGLAPTAPID